MKANQTRFGNIEIVSRGKIDNGNTAIEILLQDGTKKTLLTAFQKFYDEAGNQITDFSSIKEYVPVSICIKKEKKDSKLTQLRNDYLNRNDLVYDALKEDFVKR